MISDILEFFWRVFVSTCIYLTDEIKKDLWKK